jgi:hypothetical protein
MKFSISKFFEKKPGKLRCGDYVDYAVLESENLIVLALADGVGSTACDWKASIFSPWLNLSSLSGARVKHEFSC